ncbi:MAG TPA: RsmE family RNA methyltransferase [Verrucomicrobiae bacterium]|nr:RsmE family RNA methyltransferase [Verrucomicrobiae bacterium]
MHRFFLSPAECRKQPLNLSATEAHHAVTVLRIREGERVVVLNGAGDEILCEVQQADRRQVTLKVLQKHAIPPLPCQVTLAQAVVKGKTMEGIVQKATELGAHRIVPILSERTVARVSADDADAKVEKWEATAVEAIKQCGSPWLPLIEPPLTPQAFLARNEKFDLALIASLQGDARHPREHFHSFFVEHRRLPTAVCVWVGPEGDFTPSETNGIRQGGALPITLGELVLRSDTAAIYCLSVINYELQSPRS